MKYDRIMGIEDLMNLHQVYEDALNRRFANPVAIRCTARRAHLCKVSQFEDLQALPRILGITDWAVALPERATQTHGKLGSRDAWSYGPASRPIGERFLCIVQKEPRFGLLSRCVWRCRR